MSALYPHRHRDDVVHRDVTISRDTRNELMELAEWLEARRYLTNARIVREVVKRWDANEATEILVTEQGFMDVVEGVLGE